jgi:NRPS condensation-like uncharacterized protein
MKNKKKWYRLDTSAKIYPAIESIKNPAVFRISLCLKYVIDKDILLQALKDIKHRFPYYNVHLRSGVFWNYFEQNDNELIVWPDSPSPCERIYPTFNNGYLYKVKYYNKNITIEFFHGLTDGSGALEFLKCLVNRYLLLAGKIEGKTKGIFDIDEKPHPDESEDAFVKVLESLDDPTSINKKRTLFSTHNSFQVSGKPVKAGKLKVITGIVPVEDMKRLSKEYDVTVTQLLTALYMEALIHIQAMQVKNKNKHKNVSVQVPVNMRKYYPYRCMRNFSLFVIPSIDPRSVTKFDDIIAQVKRFMNAHVNKEHLITMIDDNISITKNQVVKHIPVGLKNMVIRYIDNTKGSTQFSGTISNFGIVKLPKNIQEHVENITLLAGPSPYNKYSCGVVGYNGNIYITLGRSIQEAYIERHLFTRLVQMGAKVKLKSN